MSDKSTFGVGYSSFDIPPDRHSAFIILLFYIPPFLTQIAQRPAGAPMRMERSMCRKRMFEICGLLKRALPTANCKL